MYRCIDQVIDIEFPLGVAYSMNTLMQVKKIFSKPKTKMLV